MPKKKLLITSDCFLPRWDGIARFLLGLIPTLTAEFDVTVIAPAFEGKEWVFKNARIIRIPLIKIRFGDIYFSRFQYDKIREEVKQADIVFNQTIGPAGICAILAAKKEKKPLISYIHSVEWELASKGIKRFRAIAHFSVRKLARWLYNKCDLLLVPSKEVEDLLAAEGIKTRKLLVKLGIDTAKFIPPLMKSQAKKAAGIDSHQRVIGFCGRIGREKDLPILINAFRQLKRKYAKLVLLIVGKGIVEQRVDYKDIILAGSVNNVVPYYQAMDIYVLPSLTETSSLTTMEAMASGLAVAVTPVGSIKEYVEHRQNGMIFPRRDVLALVETLDMLLSKDKFRAGLGAAARKTIVSRYNWYDTEKQIKQILKGF